MFGCSIRVKGHIGTTPCWELGVNLVLCHPLDSIAMSLAKVDFGNRSTWISAICINTISKSLSKLIESCYAACVLLLYWPFLNNWILLFLKLSSCSLFSRNLTCSFKSSNFSKNEGSYSFFFFFALAASNFLVLTLYIIRKLFFRIPFSTVHFFNLLLVP